MQKIIRGFVPIAPLLFLMGCGVLTSQTEDDWDFATSTAVLGATPDELEARLGPALIKQVTEVDEYGDLTFQIGECQVSYTTIEGKIAIVRFKTDQPCQSKFQGVPFLEGYEFDAKPEFGDMPPDLAGTWRSNCLSPHCRNYSAQIQFLHSGVEEGENPMQISFMSFIDTREEQEVSAAWAHAIIGRSDIYSYELDLAGICGTADQVAATRILRGLTVDWISYGYGVDESKRAGCEAPPAAAITLSGVPAGRQADVQPVQRQASTADSESINVQPTTVRETTGLKVDGPVPPSEIGGAREGMAYSEVRRRIISAGYRPVPRPEGQFCGYAPSCSLPETDACAGAGTGQCSYYFEKAGQRIEVLGEGEEEGQPQGQTVYALLFTNYGSGQ
ncbi:hypothetical protein D2V17_03390 [Aurantiacibacter xanthus]|uniref:Uncharacterized protein n=1 Tax=Aurantiacibacter xanthus TaxID=1784712 RepID=A0A3A1PCA4_9SPHN|nr:hypothetical protein [Aurantiacibacter xanthus]RIV91193.1 hypothetical protein D2V17_03390 [Aurantiacibacter xanthus]